MRKKIIIFSLLFILILFFVYFIIRNVEYDEIVPEEEISQLDEQGSNVLMYFENNETGIIEEKYITIEPKSLLINPYENLLSVLKQSPNNEKYKSIIPEGFNLKNIEVEKNLLIINFQCEDFEKYSEESLSNIKNCISDVMFQLNEINQIKLLINDIEI